MTNTSLVWLWVVVLLSIWARSVAFSPPFLMTPTRRGYPNDKTSDRTLTGIRHIGFRNDNHSKYLNKNFESRQADEGDVPNRKLRSNYITKLFHLMRPANFPGVILFHLIGIHLSLKPVDKSSLRNVLCASTYPSMIITLSAILLITASSMIVNDFYDAKSGADLLKVAHTHENKIATKPLVTGDLPLDVARDFLKLLYGSVLILSAFVPSVGSRLLVIGATIITYCYTSYLKPIVWVKNISCAFLMAVSPLTSAVANAHLHSIPYSSLWPDLWMLIISLFFGFLGREILMDINDFDADKHSGIETVPGKYGRSVASGIVFGSWILSGIFVSIGPVYNLARYILEQKTRVTFFKFIQQASFRQSLLAVSGAIMLGRRAFQVRNHEGIRNDINDTAIEECKKAVLLYLAAFI